MKWFKKYRSKNKFVITEQSNVIQYDDMGYPLRLCIGSDGKQHWRDTNEREGDVVLKWEELEE